MRKIFWSIVILLLTYPCLAAVNENEVVAKVGKIKITIGMVEKELINGPAYYLQPIPPDGKCAFDNFFTRKELINGIIKDYTIIGCAYRDGLDKKQEYIKEVNYYKTHPYGTYKDIDDFKRSLLLEDYNRYYLHPICDTSDVEIEKYYQDNPNEYHYPTEATILEICTHTKDTAEIALKRVNSGEDFLQVAKDMSITPPMEIGPFTKVDEHEDPILLDIIFSLKLNQTSDIFQLTNSDQYYIVKKIAEKALPQRELDITVKNEIRTRISRNKFYAWLDNAEKKLGVSVNYDLLKLIPPMSILLKIKQ